jgi:hypothetical protein
LGACVLAVVVCSNDSFLVAGREGVTSVAKNGRALARRG